MFDQTVDDLVNEDPLGVGQAEAEMLSNVICISNLFRNRFKLLR